MLPMFRSVCIFIVYSRRIAVIKFLRQGRRLRKWPRVSSSLSIASRNRRKFPWLRSSAQSRNSILSKSGNGTVTVKEGCQMGGPGPFSGTKRKKDVVTAAATVLNEGDKGMRHWFTDVGRKGKKQGWHG
ncbi:hypothetical protein PIB30_052509 [Stylosanthes scabra]|uniref:Uncharacterized protein n=1 Tax=Stylosanthes scabra TaxID=79078 RepID=A0ABU6WHT6_9FABA|nr:hypothetical protein [Stylosanthes scabra]